VVVREKEKGVKKRGVSSLKRKKEGKEVRRKGKGRSR
jgi:hypothetical protein